MKVDKVKFEERESELFGMKVGDSKSGLLMIAKELEVTGRHEMKKDELVKCILSIEKENHAFDTNTQDDIKSSPKAKKTTFSTDIEGFVPAAKKVSKNEHIDNAPLGTIVAFRKDDGKAKSAKIINRSKSLKKLRVETEYGEQFEVEYRRVIWVKSGHSWPRNVYNELKGIDPNEQSQETEDKQ